MKTALIALTDQGLQRALTLARHLPDEVRIYAHEHCSSLQDSARIVEKVKARESGSEIKLQTFARLQDVLRTTWPGHSLLIFFMATGIVVRAIRGFIQGKDQDPAVLVGDENGRFLIPLLSGHLGGANAWAKYLAEREASIPVITTATDVHGLIAPDEYARRFKWKVMPLENLPAVNRRLLEHGRLLYFSEHELAADHPLRLDANYQYEPKSEADVIISAFPELPSQALYLIPRVLAIGVGCRRGVSADLVVEAVQKALARVGASPFAIKGLYSIDIKAEEPGLSKAAERLGVAFATFKAAAIQAKNQEAELQPSGFVRAKIGVDAVCEAASLLGTECGSLILPKTVSNGITVAISKEKSLSSALDPATLSI